MIGCFLHEPKLGLGIEAATEVHARAKIYFLINTGSLGLEEVFEVNLEKGNS